jgi:hypothetical protein
MQKKKKNEDNEEGMEVTDGRKKKKQDVSKGVVTTSEDGGSRIKENKKRTRCGVEIWNVVAELFSFFLGEVLIAGLAVSASRKGGDTEEGNDEDAHHAGKQKTQNSQKHLQKGSRTGEKKKTLGIVDWFLGDASGRATSASVCRKNE